MDVPYERNSKAAEARSEPWRPTLSTDADAAEKPRCLGDVVREQAEREGRIGSETIGTPSEQRFTESWYERHPDKLPDSPMTMTDAARRAIDRIKKNKAAAAAEQEAAPVKRKGNGKPQRDRAAYMREYNGRKNESLTIEAAQQAARPAAARSRSSKSQIRPDTAAAAPTRQRASQGQRGQERENIGSYSHQWE